MVKSTSQSFQTTDEELLDRYAQGEPSAFEHFFLRHRGRVFQYALKRVGQPELAAEICQEVFLKLHAKIHLYKSNSPALPWFFTIVHNCCVDSMRRIVRERSFQNNLTDLSFGNEHTEQKRQEVEFDKNQNKLELKDDAYRCAVEQLSVEQKAVLEGRVIEEKSFSTMAQQSGKTEVALRKIYSRSIQKLRTLLERNDQRGGE